MILKLLLMLFFFAFLKTGYSQDSISFSSVKPFKKNSIYGTLGAGYVFDLTGSYEHMIFYPSDRKIQSIGIRLSVGPGTSVFATIMEYITAITILTSKGNNHFEFGAGADFIKEKYTDWQIVPAVNFGYRFQKPGGDYVFRTGTGFPELLYLGAGFCF